MVTEIFQENIDVIRWFKNSIIALQTLDSVLINQMDFFVLKEANKQKKVRQNRYSLVKVGNVGEIQLSAQMIQVVFNSKSCRGSRQLPIWAKWCI